MSEQAGTDAPPVAPAGEENQEPQVPTAIATDADGRAYVADQHGNEIAGADPETTELVEPPETVSDAPESETPPAAGSQVGGSVAAAAPGAPDLLIPTDGNHSPESLAAAQSAGLDTPAGRPLNSLELEILADIRTSIEGLRSWVVFADNKLKQIEGRNS